MDDLLIRRRELIKTSTTPTPILPVGYKQIEYVEKPTGTGQSSAFNLINVPFNNTSNWEIKMGIMGLGNMHDTYGYFIGCRQSSGNNTIGFGINMNQSITSIGVWDGVLCSISPNSGASIANSKYDITVTKTPTGCTITDGTNYNASSNPSPRAISGDAAVFGVTKYYTNTELVNYAYGRLYYLNIKENGIEKCNLIPCIRIGDNAVGLWDTVQEEFRTSSYTAGPDV